ncbi:uncharacterized protein LOC143276510 [Babylonia areolata]|uniref:uncharacterized protein LOC143276510 n=1 Tax=Babylonia areolata TaxID=304850 RepID=UPI003FD0FEBC
MVGITQNAEQRGEGENVPSQGSANWTSYPPPRSDATGVFTLGQHQQHQQTSLGPGFPPRVGLDNPAFSGPGSNNQRIMPSIGAGPTVLIRNKQGEVMGVVRSTPGGRPQMILTPDAARAVIQQQRARNLRARRIGFVVGIVIGIIVLGIVLGTTLRSSSANSHESDTEDYYRPTTRRPTYRPPTRYPPYTQPPYTQRPYTQRPNEPEPDGNYQVVFLYEDHWQNGMASSANPAFQTRATLFQSLIEDMYDFSSLRSRFKNTTLTGLRKLDNDTMEVTCSLAMTAASSTAYYHRDGYPTVNEIKDAFLQGYRRLLNSSESLARKRQAVKIITYTLSVSLSSSSSSSTHTPAPTTTVATDADVRCGEVRVMPDVRIVGGSEARRGSFPWMVMLVMDTDTQNGTFYCGGSILDRWTVITAGHCLADEAKDFWTDMVDTQTHRITVIAGKHESNTSISYSQEQRIPAQTAYIHPDFAQTPRLVNDIAVIRLSRPLDFNSRVAPICLPANTDPLPPVCVTAGWGALDHKTAELPNVLHTVTMRTYNRTQCQDTFWSFYYAGYSIRFYLGSSGIVCAANSTFGGQDTCQGDSGGPLFCLQKGANGMDHYAQFGVVSWGHGCGLPGEPGFYTFLPDYVSWLYNSALPKLDAHSSSSKTSPCESFSPMSQLDCRIMLIKLRQDTQCRNITEAVNCLTRSLERNGHLCREQQVLDTLVNSTSMRLTYQQKRRCQETYRQPDDICHNQTAVSTALRACSKNRRCLSMEEATICVHSFLDPRWMQCTRQDLQDFIHNHMKQSVRLCEDFSARATRDGRQFMYVDGDWYAVCADHWGQREVQLACTERGFTSGRASFIPKTKEVVYVSDRRKTLSDVRRSIKASGWMKVMCSGYESSLVECELSRQATCSSSYIAASVCYNNAYNFTLYAPQAGTDYGYVKLARDQGEGYVCVPDLSDPAAHQLCRAAGYVGGMTYPLALAPPPSLPSSTVWETEMRCDAGAVDVNGCAHGQWTQLPRVSSSCALAKVFCFSSKARLHNGLFNSTGIVQVYQSAPSGHGVTLKTVNGGNYQAPLARVLCRQLGFSGASQALSFNPFYRPNTGYIHVHCQGSESKLEDCSLTAMSSGFVAEPLVVKCTDTSSPSVPAFSVQLSPMNNEVRVYVDGQWGTVCADHWTDNEAAAICRQLGHLHGYRRFSDFEANPRRYWPHVLRDLRCGANNTSVTQCSFSRVGSNACQHKRAAAVLCSNQAEPVFSLRTTSSRPNEGLVQVDYQGTTAPLRAKESNATASVICRALGYVTGETKAASHVTSPRDQSYWWAGDATSCTSYSGLQQCLQPKLQKISCSAANVDARCGQPVVSVYCYTSAARVHTGPQQTTGIVQLYRKGQWWEVCHDDITQSAADVICRDIMGSSTASAILLSDVYQHSTSHRFRMVKASQYCDTNDSGMTSSDCLVLDLNSTCESFNNEPASVVCYDGTRPSGSITGWSMDGTYRGRVLVKRYGVWGTVCADTWRDKESQLLCEHLAHNSGRFVNRPLKHDPNTPLWAWRISCNSLFTYDISSCYATLTSDNSGTCIYNDATVQCY